MLGLRFCARAFSSWREWGPLFIAVRGPLTIAASLVAEHRLQTRRLSSCGSRAQSPCGMWDLPRPGLEPVSPALAGGFLTTALPGKPCFLIMEFWEVFIYSRNKSFYRFACIFPQSVACLFIFLIVSLGEQKILTLVKSSSSISYFVDCAFGVVRKKSLPNPSL